MGKPYPGFKSKPFWLERRHRNITKKRFKSEVAYVF